jgi:hypothetical protein
MSSWNVPMLKCRPAWRKGNYFSCNRNMRKTYRAQSQNAASEYDSFAAKYINFA